MVELMIVVTIVGILAVIGVSSVRRYILNAKSTEARYSLGQLSKDAATAYEREAMTGAALTQGQSAALSR